jgi:hypothetical protein
MSPTEAVRTRWLELLADPLTGLNAEFVQQCANRNIPTPVAADGSTASEPFDFSGTSSNVWMFQGTPEFAREGKGEPARYPCLFLYGINAIQNTGNSDRFPGFRFNGYVNLNLDVYLAWFLDDGPANNDFETPLDALEESLLSVTNRDPLAFLPILYTGVLSTQQRFPITIQREPDVFRVGLRMALNAYYPMP